MHLNCRKALLAGVLAAGFFACSTAPPQADADPQMNAPADGMPETVRRDDTRKSMGAATGAGPGERAGNVTDDNTQPLKGDASRMENFSPADREWMTKTARAGIAEVALGKLAQEKGSGDVKQFAQRVVEDHQKANEQLHEVALERGFTLPNQMDAKHRDVKARLEKLSGEEFNRVYIQNTVKEHQQDIQHFEWGAERLGDENLQAFAANTLPTLKAHLKHARELQKGLAR